MSTITHRSKPASSAPIIDNNHAVQTLYQSLEARVGYRFVLGGTRHFGYWDKDTWWMLPFGPPLRRMEDKLFQALDLPPGSRLLDAGCGVAHVALHLADRGLRVLGIDITDHHLVKARRNIARWAAAAAMSDESEGMTTKVPDVEGSVEVRKMDYHHLETLPAASFDGAYTMETLVHATDAATVLAGFSRVLRPGGRVALFEYEYLYHDEAQITPALAAARLQMRDFGAMPTWERAHRGYFSALLQDAGFVDVHVRDFSLNIRPMLRFFWLLALIPNFFIQLLGLQRYFINTVGGAYAYTARDYWRYVVITARKPVPGESDPKMRVSGFEK